MVLLAIPFHYRYEINLAASLASSHYEVRRSMVEARPQPFQLGTDVYVELGQQVRG